NCPGSVRPAAGLNRRTYRGIWPPPAEKDAPSLPVGKDGVLGRFHALVHALGSTAAAQRKALIIVPLARRHAELVLLGARRLRDADRIGAGKTFLQSLFERALRRVARQFVARPLLDVRIAPAAFGPSIHDCAPEKMTL